MTTGSIKHELVVGFNLSKTDTNSKSLFNETTPLDVFNPVYGSGTEASLPDFDIKNTAQQLGFYLQDQITLAENFKVLLGGRYYSIPIRAFDRYFGLGRKLLNPSFPNKAISLTAQRQGDRTRSSRIEVGGRGAHAMTITIAILSQDDIDILKNIDPDVFDDAIDLPRAIEFLADPRHHLVVAIDNNLVIGFVFAVHYVHPDKPLPELWINEIGVAATHQRQGIGKRLMNTVLEVGRELGCEVAWVLTDRDNTAAMSLYASVGNPQAPSNHVMFSFDLE